MQLDVEEADAGYIAARPGEAGDEAGGDRVVAAQEDDRDHRGCAFRPGRGRAARHDHVDLAADEFGGQSGQSIVVTLRPTVFDRHIRLGRHHGGGRAPRSSPVQKPARRAPITVAVAAPAVLPWPKALALAKLACAP